MLLLSFSIAYTGGRERRGCGSWRGWRRSDRSVSLPGLELTFYSGVYGTCIGAMTQFGHDAKSLIGISGICIGVGEILGESRVKRWRTRTEKVPLDYPEAGIHSYTTPGTMPLHLPRPVFICLTRRRPFWDAEQEQWLWEKPSGAAGPLHPLCCFLSDFSQHCQRRPDSPRGWDRPAGLHHTQVKTRTLFSQLFIVT